MLTIVKVFDKYQYTVQTIDMHNLLRKVILQFAIKKMHLFVRTNKKQELDSCMWCTTTKLKVLCYETFFLFLFLSSPPFLSKEKHNKYQTTQSGNIKEYDVSK